MPREFKPERGPWATYAPSAWQAGLCFPTPIALDMRGRVELVIGRLGAGKTTWAALRAQRLARATDRQLYTTGQDWPRPWRSIDSFDALEEMRDGVLVWDELHLMLPSTKGLLSREHERRCVKVLSLLRKRGNDVIGTTQAWTRCATHYRQLVTTVWVAEPVNRGKLHRAIGFDPPEDGGRQAASPQWYGPAAAAIPTNATVWTGHDYLDDERPEGATATPAAVASQPVPLPSFITAVTANDPGLLLPGPSITNGVAPPCPPA
jgi:hypothetical protein